MMGDEEEGGGREARVELRDAKTASGVGRESGSVKVAPSASKGGTGAGDATEIWEFKPVAGIYKKELLRRARWGGGGCFQDFVWFARNNHPLFSIFLAHSKHPYSWGERIEVLLTSTALRLLLTALLSANTAQALASGALEGEAARLAVFVDSIIIGFVNSVLTLVLQQFAVLDEWRCLGDYEKGCCKSCVGCFGRGLIRCTCCLVLLAFGLVVGLDEETQGAMGQVGVAFGISMIHSYTWQWLLLSLPYFWIVSCRDSQRDQERQKQGLLLVTHRLMLAYHQQQDIDALSSEQDREKAKKERAILDLEALHESLQDSTQKKTSNTHPAPNPLNAILTGIASKLQEQAEQRSTEEESAEGGSGEEESGEGEGEGEGGESMETEELASVA